MTRLGKVLHAALRDEWDGLERINKDIRLADLFTLLNGLMGFMAILLVAHGRQNQAIYFVLVGIILDGVDGAVARLGKGNGPLGGVLDTLADAVTFCVTPAVVTLLVLPSAANPGVLAVFLVPLALYFVCGLLRLARFESLRDDGKTGRYFSGLPTPAAAMALMAMSIVGVPAPWLLSVTTIVALLMVSRIRFPKLRGWGAVAAVTILLAVLVSARLSKERTVHELITWGMLAFMAIYVAFGPFWVLARHGPTPEPESAPENATT